MSAIGVLWIVPASAQVAATSYCPRAVIALGVPVGAFGGEAVGITNNTAYGFTFGDNGSAATTWRISAFGVDVRRVLGDATASSTATNLDRDGNVAVVRFPDSEPLTAMVVRPDHSRVMLRGATPDRPSLNVGGGSDNGKLAGSATSIDGTSLLALRWDRPTVDPTPVELQPLPGDLNSYANDVSRTGVTVGTSVSAQGVARAVLWDRRGLVHALQMPAVDPGYGQPNSISEDGSRITGLVGPTPARRFAIWNPHGVLVALPPLRGEDAAVGYGVSPDGHAFVGESDLRATTGIRHAVYTIGEALRPLPPLGTGLTDRNAQADAVDSHDQAVGYSQPTPDTDIQPTLWRCVSNYRPVTATTAELASHPVALPAASIRAQTLISTPRARSSRTSSRSTSW